MGKGESQIIVNKTRTFIGKESDAESNLGDFGARKYDARIGRFTSVDALWAIQPEWSPYHYSANDPINKKDPSGYAFETLGGAIWISIFLGAEECSPLKEMWHIKIPWTTGISHNSGLASPLGIGFVPSKGGGESSTPWNGNFGQFQSPHQLTHGGPSKTPSPAQSYETLPQNQVVNSQMEELLKSIRTTPFDKILESARKQADEIRARFIAAVAATIPTDQVSVIALLDEDGASGTGHAAVLIGSEANGWKLYSKNGGTLAVSGKTDAPQDGEEFRTLSLFFESAEKEKQQGRYDHAVIYPISRSRLADARAAASESVNSNYWLIGNSCLDVVSSTLGAVGMRGCSFQKYSSGMRTSISFLTSFPNIRFWMMQRANGGVNVTPSIIIPWRHNNK